MGIEVKSSKCGAGIEKIDNLNYKKYLCYGKFKNWILCNKFELPCVKEVYLMTELASAVEIERLKELGEAPLFVRTDAPVGMGNLLPRGRNVFYKDLNDFFLEVKKRCSEGILLFSKNPSVILTGGYIPRYKLDGGVMVVIEKPYYVTVEYVGKGFDAGELTRGKAVHSSIKIPYQWIYDKPVEIYRNCKYTGNIYIISQKDYEVSRICRMIELEQDLKEPCSYGGSYDIPLIASYMDEELFVYIYEECISKVIYSELKMKKIIGLIINIYGGKLCVLEIWSPERSRV